MKTLEIKNAVIAGIRHPFFHFEGEVEDQTDEYIIEIDGHNTNYNITRYDNMISIETPIPNQAKEVTVYVKNDNETTRILAMKNNITKRIIRGINRRLILYRKKIQKAYHLSQKGVNYLWVQYHFLVPPKLLIEYGKKFINKIRNVKVSPFYDPLYKEEYLQWLKENEKETTIKPLAYNPLISILIPVYNVDYKYLSECLDSILRQTYSNLEICLVDDCSAKQETIDTLRLYLKKDPRIRVIFRSKNGNISEATNDALRMAHGEYVALMDDDDVLDPNALYEIVRWLNANKNIDMIYSDEDKLDLDGRRCNPHFKPDWSPDTLLSLNYINHLAVLRKSIVDEIGGFTVGLEGSQDYDLFLRFTEKTNNIYHIPKILYHWRMAKGSSSMSMDNKTYALENGKKALENALKRRNIKGYVEIDNVSKYYRVVYEYDQEPKISIIIPTRDYADILDACLKSLYQQTDYQNYEVLVVNNNSQNPETIDLFEKYERQHNNFHVIDADMEFNYSRLNNLAVQEANGEYMVLLNNDTEIISPNWLKIMVGYAMQPHMGAVGVKLLYPNATIQHGGVILGLGGVASHAYIGEKREASGMYGRLSVPYNYSAVTGACLMIEKGKYMAVQGLEEQLKVAYNDVDLGLKLLGEGYNSIFLPQIEVMHHESKTRGLDTTEEKKKRLQVEAQYMYEKWQNKLTDPFYNPNYSEKSGFLLSKRQ